jgi:hypothetical protein
VSRLTQPHRRKYDELLTRLFVQLLLKPRLPARIGINIHPGALHEDK